MMFPSRKRAAPMALPESVAWLEHLTLEMTTKANKRVSLSKRNNVLYELHMTYKPQKNEEATTWTVARTFDEYRSLQRRLVKALKPGHKCNAECRWVCNVVKNHFPKVALFCKNCPATVESRRLSLLRVLTTVKTSLVNRGNLGCAVFRDEVSKEFASFLVGTCKDSALLAHSNTASSTDSTASPSDDKSDDRSASIVSFTSDEENQVLNLEFDDDFSDFDFVQHKCGLCGLSLDCEESSPYCTTAAFGCGHEFHDACVLPQLDEDVRCPMCRHEESNL
ncbi:hypothetical protein BBJ28_00021995 [Nothophytophthora sp. Chile5]|nr:hypothetical protein BBJ28_00021995 [Nothophytophthora sp. Chile5]